MYLEKAEGHREKEQFWFRFEVNLDARFEGRFCSNSNRNFTINERQYPEFDRSLSQWKGGESATVPSAPPIHLPHGQPILLQPQILLCGELRVPS